jgi:2-(1,2-epoxy-1,2-dihydrophenyl)acetyl-CoA isomerase
MTTQSMTLSVSEGVARLVLTEAARGNPIDRRFCFEINEVAIDLSSRDDVRAVLITAEGKAFSYGGDISGFISKLDALPAEVKGMTTLLHSAIARLQRMDAPIVAAVHGVCAGGMAGFIAGCDIILASEGARFVAAYPGIGFSCDAGSSVMLSRRMGLGKARHFLLTNGSLDARHAFEAGLVDELVEASELPARAEALAVKLAAGPTKAFGEIRRLLLSAQNQPLETQLELEAQALAGIASTADAREGLQAFAEKRKAAFRGR